MIKQIKISNNNLINRVVVVLAVAVFTPVLAQGEELKVIFDKVQQYYQDKNYAKALEELGWAQKEIEKASSQVTQSFFPNEVDGYKGGQLENQNAFGILNVERLYEKNENQSIKVSLTGSSKGGAQNPFAGLAALGQMAAATSDSFRLDGRTAIIEKEEGSTSLTVFLDGGAMMKFDMSGSNDSEVLKKFANGFKIADIEKHLKG